MSYNHGKEERKWRSWKQAEEKKLRQLGVNEDIIQRLHEHDWAVFNSERRYYEKRLETSTYLDEVAESVGQTEIKTVEDLLDSIEDERLYKVLITVDKQTLQALILNLQGFSVSDISVVLKINEQTIYKRLKRLKEKIKKLLG